MCGWVDVQLAWVRRRTRRRHASCHKDSTKTAGRWLPRAASCSALNSWKERWPCEQRSSPRSFERVHRLVCSSLTLGGAQTGSYVGTRHLPAWKQLFNCASVAFISLELWKLPIRTSLWSFRTRSSWMNPGDCVTATATVEGAPLIAHVWLDKKRKHFVSTCGTTLPGEPLKKKRYRRSEDSLPEAFFKETKRPAWFKNISMEQPLSMCTTTFAKDLLPRKKSGARSAGGTRCLPLSWALWKQMPFLHWSSGSLKLSILPTAHSCRS